LSAKVVKKNRIGDLEVGNYYFFDKKIFLLAKKHMFFLPNSQLFSTFAII
jgi:hypothetical protein